MIFWLAVATGGLFAWIAVQIGFYATWILFFHLLLAAYAAIFLTPVIIANVPDATTTDYGYALIFVGVAVATLCIGYGICFACLMGQLRVEFPKIFDGIGAGLLGFQVGFLLLSFLSFTLCLTPLAKSDLFKTVGLDARAKEQHRLPLLVVRPAARPCRSAGAPAQQWFRDGGPAGESGLAVEEPIRHRGRGRTILAASAPGQPVRRPEAGKQSTSSRAQSEADRPRRPPARRPMPRPALRHLAVSGRRPLSYRRRWKNRGCARDFQRCDSRTDGKAGLPRGEH